MASAAPTAPSHASADLPIRPLWLRIWLAVLASIIVFAVFAGVAWHLYFDPARVSPNPEAIALAIVDQLAPANAPHAEQQATIADLHYRYAIDIAVFDRDGNPLAIAGRPVPPPRADEADSHWLMPRRPAGSDGAGAGLGHPDEADDGHVRRPAFALHLSDGRWLVVRRPVISAPRPPRFGLLGTLALIALAIAVGAYPVVRRLTRRLERLRASVDALGAGDFSARVKVEGKDEVGVLADRFNHAAARIEALVTAQKNLLANASHELRSPLARIRMAVEMLGDRPTEALLAEVRTNVGELDGLVEEILLASRLDSASALPAFENVDLTAIAAEECARADAQLDAVAVEVDGDARLLRRLLRNLIENAKRYGADTPVEVRLAREGAQVKIEVCDRGPGIPPAERERVFEPFYRAAGGRERDGGVGLGLALVRQIAERHAGTVACTARDGGGACFVVALPARA